MNSAMRKTSRSVLRAATRTTRPGSRSRRAFEPIVKTIDSGWSRCSDGIAVDGGDKRIAERLRPLMIQPRQVNPLVLGAGGEQGERAQPVAPLDRALGHVGVLDAGARHRDDVAPEHAAA